MPIKTVVRNREDDSIVVYRIFGAVMPDDVFSCVDLAFQRLPPERPYLSLQIFESDTDLSELTPKTLESFRAYGEKTYLEKKLGPRTGAAVINGSSDAKLMLPLFNALVASRDGVDFTYEPYRDIDSALDHLKIDRREGHEIIAQTA